MPQDGTVEARFASFFSRLFCFRSVFFECNGSVWVRSTSGSSSSASTASYRTVALTFVLALAMTAVGLATAVLVLAISGGPAAFTAPASLKVELREWRLDRDADVVVGILELKQNSR